MKTTRLPRSTPRVFLRRRLRYASISKKLLPVFLLMLTVVFGCDGSDTIVGVCPASEMPSIIVEVLDFRGQPAAIGATATITREGITGTAEGFGSPLSIPVFAQNAGGTFDVRITKPWHRDTLISDVVVPEGFCGVGAPVTVQAVLSLLPSAPPVRQVILPPHDFGFGLSVCGSPRQIDGYVLTDESASDEIIWESRDQTVARVEPRGTGTSGHNTALLIPECNAAIPSSTYIVGTSKADPSVRDSFEVTIHL